MKNKKAAMEMSVGTIVTIVLLMSVLVLGIFLVQKIFSSGTNAIDQIDSQVQSEINKLFSDEAKRVVVYPTSRQISLKQGDEGGFALSVRNTDRGEGSHQYNYQVLHDQNDCNLEDGKAQNYIQLRSEGEFRLANGQILENPILVKFSLPEDAPLCLIGYKIVVYEDGNQVDPYTSTSMDLEIK